jgi:hypothetical protein
MPRWNTARRCCWLQRLMHGNVIYVNDLITHAFPWSLSAGQSRGSIQHSLHRRCGGVEHTAHTSLCHTPQSLPACKTSVSRACPRRSRYGGATVREQHFATGLKGQGLVSDAESLPCMGCPDQQDLLRSYTSALSARTARAQSRHTDAHLPGAERRALLMSAVPRKTCPRVQAQAPDVRRGKQL